MKFIKLKESLEDKFKLALKAAPYKCKITQKALEEFNNEEECLEDIQSIYEFITTKYSPDKILYWTYLDGVNAFKVILSDHTIRTYEFTEDSIEEITPNLNKSSNLSSTPTYSYKFTYKDIDNEIKEVELNASSAREAFNLFKEKYPSTILQDIDGIVVPLNLR